MRRAGEEETPEMQRGKKNTKHKLSQQLPTIFPHSKTINRENKILLLHILGHYFLNTNLSNSIKYKQELCMEKEETISS